eukprot:6667660-Prymnesium_polylepis.2
MLVSCTPSAMHCVRQRHCGHLLTNRFDSARIGLPARHVNNRCVNGSVQLRAILVKECHEFAFAGGHGETHGATAHSAVKNQRAACAEAVNF